MIKVGIVGGTGYTGVELLRLLVLHKNVELIAVTSRSAAGTKVADMFPNLRGHVELCYTAPDFGLLKTCDVVFFATPNGTAMTLARDLLETGVKLIDLSADFRLRDQQLWSQWYGMAHACPELLAEAIYGLPEVNRSEIKNARLVANPGCYPTAVQLGFLPLIEAGLIDDNSLIADVKSGVSGAGRKADVGVLLCETSENMKAYAVAGHRHLPEIKQGLGIAAGKPVGLTFVPHLTPMIRGIHATLYGALKGQVQELHDQQALRELYTQRYAGEAFVDVLPDGVHPETRSVKGSNMCRISVFKPQSEDRVVILSVIDNLLKGAAGQAIQNMNIMFNFRETEGLTALAVLP